MVDYPYSLPVLYHWWEGEDLGANGTNITSWTDRAGHSNLTTSSGNPTVVTASTPAGGKSARFGGAAVLQATNAIQTALVTATVSSNLNASYPAWKVIDGKSASFGWASSAAPSVGTPQWAQLDFVTAFVATSVQITIFLESARGPKDFKIQGWNGSSWDDLLTVTGETTWTNASTKNYSITNSTAYTRYRLICTLTQGNDILYLGEVTFNNVANTAGAEAWFVIKSDGNTGFPIRISGSQDTRYVFSSDSKVYGDWGSALTRASYTPAAAVTNWHLLRMRADGAGEVKYEVNGALEFTHTGVTPAWITPMLMAQGGAVFAGNMGAILMLPPQNDTIASYLRYYFNNKHGLSAANATAPPAAASPGFGSRLN